MKVENIKCELVDVKSLDVGSYIALQRSDNKEIVTITVDEKAERVIRRLKEQYDGKDSREGVYLSRMMTNINISTTGDVWDINEEDGKYYSFSKSDVLEIIKRYQK